MSEPRPKITPRQRRSFELFCRQLADCLNDAGLDVQVVLKERVSVSWDHASVREFLWKPLQKAVLGKQSTKLLDKTGDIDQVYDTLNRFLGTKWGLEVPPWPHFEEDEFEKITSSQ